MRYNNLFKKILEAIGDVPPPPAPTAIIQKADNTVLTFDDIKALIQKHEGIRPHIYNDSMGIPTVGIGFNMRRPDAKAIFHRLNLNYNNVLSGSEDLTDQQMQDLFTECLKIAYKDVKYYIPSFDNLPKNIKLGLIDLSFNLGFGRLNKFVKTKQFIMAGKYKEAAGELKDSKWATQVGNRAKDIINLFSSAS